jgi:hypothetical protein
VNLQDLLQFAVKRERLERAEFVGPMEKRKEVIDALYDAGWHITRSGPYVDSDIWPQCDITRFLFIAECIMAVEKVKKSGG